MKKILVLGATGMAGHMIYYYLQSLNKYKMYSACFRKKLENTSIMLNVYKRETISELLREINPDYVINCVGVLIKGSVASPDNAIYINAYYPHLLSYLVFAHNQSAKLIHISTDCVFSGKKGLYAETDIKDALDIYGMTKNLGEVKNINGLTIRTSIIGPELKNDGEGLFHWIFKQREKGTIDGYEKALWGGVTTLELAKAIEQFIIYNITGIYQLTNGKKISKYELIKYIITKFNLKIVLNKIDGINIDKSMVSSGRDGFVYTVPPYNIMVNELYQFMYDHKNIYAGYLEQ